MYISLPSFFTSVEESDDNVCLRVNLRENPQAAEIHRMLYEWQAAANALRAYAQERDEERERDEDDGWDE